MILFRNLSFHRRHVEMGAVSGHWENSIGGLQGNSAGTFTATFRGKSVDLRTNTDNASYSYNGGTHTINLNILRIVTFVQCFAMIFHLHNNLMNAQC